ncbi:MAG: hypothetical protein ABSG53_19550, partial [Thermoguttaceae bacterium]
MRIRIVRLLAIRGLSVIVTAVLATVIALGWIDYWVRFRDRGVLVVFAAVVLGVFAWTGCLAVRRLLRARLGDTNVALHLEACFPSVNGHLASAVEFLRQPEDDAMAGSAAMRRAAIAQATAASEDLDFDAVIDRRSALRSALAALTVVLLAAGISVVDAAAARTALARLAFPLGTADWPQRTHLALRQPLKPIVVVRGQALEVEVYDTQDAPLPSDCRIHYRFRDVQGRLKEETEPMQLLSNKMVARRENVISPLEFCFTGGDDRNMHWTEVQVIEPPAIRSLTLRITPPSYTNWPEEERAATTTRPLLAGSRVQLTGKATKRLKPASEMRFDDGHMLPIEIDGDGVTFHVGKPSARALAEPPHELIVQKSTGYSFHLIDVDGVPGGGDESWQFRVLTDAPPIAMIEQPGSDLFVTERAVVSFRVRARDDMALRQVLLVVSLTDAKATKEKTIPLLQGPDKPSQSSSSAFGEATTGDQATIDRTVELSEFQLAPGMQLTCQAVASDYHAQTSRSDPRVLTVITPNQLLERMAVRQSQILGELARVLQLQRDARSQVRMLEIRLQETTGLEQADIDRLQAAEFNQREVVRSLTSRSDGLPMLVLSLLADLENNRVDNPDFQRRLAGLLTEFDHLQREHLPLIGTELTATIKGSQVRLQSSPRLAGRDAESELHLANAGEHQQQVVASLEGLLARLRQWDDYRRFHREVVQLLRDQEETARKTAALGAQTVGRDLKELSAQELADLKIRAEHQFELARRETRLEEEMEQTVATLGQSDPLAAGTLTDAVAEARRLAIAADMSTAGGKIRNNGLGLAPADQQRILQNVQEVLDILANNRPQELERLARKLGETERDLNALCKRQEGLRRKIDESVEPSGRQLPRNEKQKAELQKLARQQEELQQQAQQFGRRLERLLAEEAANATDKAAGRMEQARRAGDAGDGQGASREAQEAENALNDASRLLRQKRFEIEAQLAMEQQARVQDAIKHIHRQEERIAAETREFAELERAGTLTRTQISSLLELAHQQALLRDETGRVAQSLGPVNIFRVALEVAIDEMGRVSVLLQRRQTGPTTQRAEQNAIDRLKLILTAIEGEESGKPASGDDPGKMANGNDPGNQGGDNRNAEPRGVLPLAQLKLLKLLQEDLN